MAIFFLSNAYRQAQTIPMACIVTPKPADGSTRPSCTGMEPAGQQSWLMDHSSFSPTHTERKRYRTVQQLRSTMPQEISFVSFEMQTAIFRRFRLLMAI